MYINILVIVLIITNDYSDIVNTESLDMMWKIWSTVLYDKKKYFSWNVIQKSKEFSINF